MPSAHFKSLPATRRIFGQKASADHPCKLCLQSCPGRRSMCGPCFIRVRRFRVKAAGVALLGWQARCCGWRGGLGEIAGYVFHHPADSGKVFNVCEEKQRPWHEVKAEVLKCELWCARCHCIHHSKYSDARFLAMAAAPTDEQLIALASRQRNGAA